MRQAGVDNTFDTHTLQNVLRSNTEMLDEKNRRIEELERLADRYLSDTLPVKDISHELRSLWGSHIRSVSLAKAPVFGNDGNAIDTAVFCYLTTAENVSLDRQQREKLTQWLRARTKMNKVELIVARQEADTASMR